MPETLVEINSLFEFDRRAQMGCPYSDSTLECHWDLDGPIGKPCHKCNECCGHNIRFNEETRMLDAPSEDEVSEFTSTNT